MNKLNTKEIEFFCSTHKDWQLNQGRLEKTFVFANFSKAVLFVNKMVNPIEENQSYPVIKIAYNRVSVSLFNPEIGELTATELNLAHEMDLLS